MVATVGKFEAKPGAINVIAGEARLTLDVRHSSDEIRTRAVDDLIRQAQDIAAAPWIIVRGNVLMNQPAVAMDPFLVGEIEQAISQDGCEPHRMVSGGGSRRHDPGGKSSERDDFSANARRDQPRSRRIGAAG